MDPEPQCLFTLKENKIIVHYGSAPKQSANIFLFNFEACEEGGNILKNSNILVSRVCFILFVLLENVT